MSIVTYVPSIFLFWMLYKQKRLGLLVQALLFSR